MERYIYADDIKNAIEGVTRNYLSTPDAIDSVTAKWLYKRLKTLVDEMPTADAVPVVRCKECKHRHQTTCPFLIANAYKTSADDDFCSRGERKCNED